MDWCLWLQVWGLNLDEVEHEASLLVREPITESENREKAKTDAYRSLGELAALMVEDGHGWAEPERERAGGRLWKVIPYADAWHERYEGAKERLRQAVLAGELEGKEEGRTLRIRGDAFEAWYGRRLCGKPEWGAGYDVRPDEQAARVAADRLVFEAIQRSLQSMPLEHVPTKSLPVRARSVAGLTAGMREYLGVFVEYSWCWLRSIEIVVQWIGERFDGEDPLRPVRRGYLEECREGLDAAQRAGEVRREGHARRARRRGTGRAASGDRSARRSLGGPQPALSASPTRLGHELHRRAEQGVIGGGVLRVVGRGIATDHERARVAEQVLDV
jgi:hypothetical protein